MTDSRQLADRLRAAANILDAHPDLPTPVVFAYSATGRVDVTWQLMNDDTTKTDQRAAAQTIIRRIGGTWDKNPWGERFDFAQERDGLTLGIAAHRDQVCERVVVGTETVTVPAVDAAPERTEVREVVEWRCEPLLADDDRAGASSW